MPIDNRSVQHIYLGIAPEVDSVAERIFGRRMIRRASDRRSFSLELLCALKQAGTVIVTGGFEGSGSWPPFDTVSGAYRLMVGRELDTQKLVALSDHAGSRAYRLNAGGTELYLCPGDIRTLDSSYAHIAGSMGVAEANAPRVFATAPASGAERVIHTAPSAPPAAASIETRLLRLEQIVRELIAKLGQNSPSEPKVPRIEKSLRPETEPKEAALKSPKPEPTVKAERAGDSAASEYPDISEYPATSYPPSRPKAFKRAQGPLIAVACVLFVGSIYFLTTRVLETSYANRQADVLRGIRNAGQQTDYAPPGDDQADGYFGGETAGGQEGYQAAPLEPGQPGETMNPESPGTTDPPQNPGNPGTNSAAPGVTGGSGSLESLRAMNPDVVGWIKVADTQIDGPVMQSGADNPDFYLEHDFYKQSARLGALYLDASNAVGISRNMTIYGHHAQGGLFFGELKSYQKQQFYNSHPTFTFETLNGSGQWVVFAVITVPDGSDGRVFFEWRKQDFSDDEEFMSFINEIKSRNELQINVDVAPGDRLINLVTCSADLYNSRLVVFARELRGGETPSGFLR